MRCATLIHRQMVLIGSIRPENTHTRHGNMTTRPANHRTTSMSKEKNRANNVLLRTTLLQTSRPPLAPNAQGLHNLLQQHHCLSQSRNPHHHYRPRPADYRKRRRGCLKHYWLARTSCRQHPRHRLWTLCLMSKTNKQDVHSLMNRRCASKQSRSRRLRKIVLAGLVSPPSWSTAATSQMRRHLRTLRTGVS
jgi:hypothetical protein